VSWLMLAAIGMIWAALLLPHERGGAPGRTVREFERNMELLAGTGGRDPGRWIVTPRKGIAFVGSHARAQQRARERRRRVFTLLLEGIAFTLMIGLVPPLRSAWYVTAVLLLLLAVYVWLLLWMKQREPRTEALERTRMIHAPDRATVPAPTARYVGDAASRSPRPAYTGLTVDGEDAVHIVVRPATGVQGAGV
jgi:hypothetical protein